MQSKLFLSLSVVALLGVSTVVYGEWIRYKGDGTDARIPKGDCLEMMCNHGCVEDSDNSYVGLCCDTDGKNGDSCKAGDKNVAACCQSGECDQDGKCVGEPKTLCLRNEEPYDTAEGTKCCNTAISTLVETDTGAKECCPGKGAVWDAIQKKCKEEEKICDKGAKAYTNVEGGQSCCSSDKVLVDVSDKKIDGKQVQKCCDKSKPHYSPKKGCVGCTSKDAPSFCGLQKDGTARCCAKSCNFKGNACCKGKKLTGFVSSCIKKENGIKELCDACTLKYRQAKRKITCIYSEKDGKETCIDPWFYKGQPHGIAEAEISYAQHWSKPVDYYADSDTDMKLIFNLSKLEPSEFKYIRVVDKTSGDVIKNITSSGSTLKENVTLKAGHHYRIEVDFKTYCAKASSISVECQKKK